MTDSGKDRGLDQLGDSDRIGGATVVGGKKVTLHSGVHMGVLDDSRRIKKFYEDLGLNPEEYKLMDEDASNHMKGSLSKQFEEWKNSKGRPCKEGRINFASVQDAVTQAYNSIKEAYPKLDEQKAEQLAQGLVLRAMTRELEHAAKYIEGGEKGNAPTYC